MEWEHNKECHAFTWPGCHLQGCSPQMHEVKSWPLGCIWTSLYLAEDIWKTAFMTISGMYVSNIMQQGDCNAPAMFQWLVTFIFHNVIERFLHIYLDDIFIFSDMPEEHEQHLQVVVEWLHTNPLCLKWSKCNLYADKVDRLGHIIDKDSIHADVDKFSHIREWCTPWNYNDIQCFVGLVNYLVNFLPDVTAYTMPLIAMT